MTWLWWALILLAQNASFTWVSRARNSASLPYHAIASVCSNGVWIIGQFVIFDKFMEVKNSGDTLLLVAVVTYYTAFTVAGSVGMHHLLMKYVESGKRNVGAKP